MDGIKSDVDVAVGAVFETDGEGDAGGEFTVELRFGGTSADCAPGDEVADELWGDGVEEFGAGWYAHGGLLTA